MDPDAWKRLGDLVRRRRQQLGMSQGQKPPSAATWRKVENAIDHPYAERTVLAICDALHWEPESFDQILAGGEPTETVEDASAAPPWEQLLAGQRELSDRLEQIAALLERGD